MADPNDDKTILEATAAAPKSPQHMEQTEGDNTLPVGTRLGEFELIGLVGIGGFGIVYLAEDHSLGRRVALKEYMPSSLASRSQGSQVGVKSQRHAETFEAGRRSFVNEARLLAQFDHPSLVKVYRFWEGNGTAYMVMPFYEGITLKQALKQMPAPPDETWLRRMLAPVLDALEVLHDAQVFHRDIAPDNIMLLAGEWPLLLDFGAARRVISDMTQALTVILKPGYAPVEQYAEMPEMKQGAWTDIYALSAVVYFAIMGKTPPPAVGRIMNDTMAPLAQQAAGRYSERFLRAVDRGLAVKPEDRPRSIAELRDLFGIEHGPTTVPTSITQTAGRPSGPITGGKPTTMPAPAPTPPEGKSGPSAGLLIGGLFAAAALAGGGYYYTRIHQPQQATVTQAPAVTPPVAPAPSTPPAGDSMPAAPASTALATPPPDPSAAVPAKPFSPLDELDRIFQQRTRDHAVAVELDQARVRIGRDKLRFRLRSSKAGYLYILMVGTDYNHFYKLFPNSVDERNRVEAGREIRLPRSGWSMVAGGPPGANQFVAVVSEYPRDFSATGLAKVDPFAEFPLDAAERLAAASAGGQSPFLGKLSCPDGGSACSDAYGAAAFTIEEVEATVAAPAPRPRQRQQQQAQQPQNSAEDEAEPPPQASGRRQQQALPSDGRPPGQSLNEFVTGRPQQNRNYYPYPSAPPARERSGNDIPAGIPNAARRMPY